MKLTLLGGLYGGLIFGNFLLQKSNGIRMALSLSDAKGIINLGAGCSRTGFSEALCELPEVVYNIDLDANCPKCVILNLEERLPFADKQFDVAFASHVLEHLVNWEQALDEWMRIADYVVIVLPHPFDLSGWVHFDHKQHFNFADINYIRALPSVQVFA